MHNGLETANKVNKANKANKAYRANKAQLRITRLFLTTNKDDKANNRK